MSAVCRAWREVGKELAWEVLPVVYKENDKAERAVEGAHAVKLMKHLLANPSLCDYVATVVILVKHDDFPSRALRSLAQLLAALPHAQLLHIEAPAKVVDALLHSPSALSNLSSLRALTLQPVGSKPYPNPLRLLAFLTQLTSLEQLDLALHLPARFERALLKFLPPLPVREAVIELLNAPSPGGTASQGRFLLDLLSLLAPSTLTSLTLSLPFLTSPLLSTLSTFTSLSSLTLSAPRPSYPRFLPTLTYSVLPRLPNLLSLSLLHRPPAPGALELAPTLCSSRRDALLRALPLSVQQLEADLVFVDALGSAEMDRVERELKAREPMRRVRYGVVHPLKGEVGRVIWERAGEEGDGQWVCLLERNEVVA
ncbi:hypothetical protein JCM10213_001441 [Rhodosporidiobolus nylandii]